MRGQELVLFASRKKEGYEKKCNQNKRSKATRNDGVSCERRVGFCPVKLEVV